MRVRVRVFGALASIIGRNHHLDLEENATVRTLIFQLARESYQTRQGYLGEYKIDGGNLAIILNGKNIALLDGLSTSIYNGDEVVILPPTAGG